MPSRVDSGVDIKGSSNCTSQTQSVYPSGGYRTEAGTTLEIGVLKTNATTDKLWQEFVRTPFTHPQIPNVSFAGYRTGAVIPTPPVVANVLDFGAKADGSKP